MPDFEPRGCPRGASFSWYLYSPLRIKYPYLRSDLAELWREARKSHKTALEAWRSIADDPAKKKRYKAARGMGGFVRSNWDEVSELIASSLLYTVEKYGPDRNFGFSVIPAKSMLSYAAGLRFMQLMGGAGLSFYDWYADLPPASPQVWGDQTDVPESSDWYNAGYIITWGSNVPLTRTPDAHFLTEVRYKGTKVVSVAPDYAESTTVADTWISLHTGSDAALAMAMGHVILKEYYIDKEVPFFVDYVRRFTDFPFLVLLDEKEDGGFLPGRFLNAKDMGRADEKHADFKFYVVDEMTERLVVPNGTMGDRWDRQAKWNLKEEDSDTGETIKARLSVLDVKDDAIEVTLPYFGTEREEMLLKRMVPVKKIKTAAGERLVTTVYDLTMANYAIDRGLGGEAVSSYEDDVPYTPHWQEKYTGVSPELAIHTAREMADNSIKTDGRTMVIMGAGINHWYNLEPPALHRGGRQERRRLGALRRAGETAPGGGLGACHDGDGLAAGGASAEQHIVLLLRHRSVAERRDRHARDCRGDGQAALPPPRRLQRTRGTSRLAAILPDVQQERAEDHRRGEGRGS